MSSKQKFRLLKYLIIGFLAIGIIYLVARFVKEMEKYDFKGDFSEGFAAVKLNGKYGFINANEEEIISIKYDTVESFRNGVAHVKDSLWGYIDTLGNELVKLKYTKDVSMFEALKGKWERKADFKGNTGRYNALSFSVNDKVYVGGGEGTRNSFSDFWEYNPSTNLWTKKSPLPGGRRDKHFCFIIDEKAYVGGGKSWKILTSKHCYTDLLKYNPDKDTWESKSSIPNIKCIQDAASFTLNNKGYLISGDFSKTFKGLKETHVLEYDANEDKWTKKNNFPGERGFNLIGFTVNNRSFIAFNKQRHNKFYYSELWEYKPEADSWQQKKDLPHGIGAYFVIGNRAFIRYTSDYYFNYTKDGRAERIVHFDDQLFYEYNPDKDVWFPKTKFKGENYREFFVFAGGKTKGYIGCGWTPNYYKPFSDFWEFDPNVEE